MYHRIPVYEDKRIDNVYRFLENSIPLEEYDKRIRLDVFRSKNYVSPDAWADTMPPRRIIRMLPEELSDYRLPIEKHEVLHNAFSEASECFIHNAAFNPSYDTVLKRFELVYH